MRQHLYIPDDGGRDTSVYLAELDTLLQSERLPATFVEVYRDGIATSAEQWTHLKGPPHRIEKVVRTEALFDLYSAGSTLVVNGVHRSLPSFTRLCRNLSQELGIPCQANVYITPPNARGLARHADSHEVLVLQLYGSKTWTLFPGAGEPLEINAGTGDVLFMPAGLGHEAASAEVASVHVTLGLKPVYAYDLVEELAILARSNPAFRTPVTPPAGEIMMDDSRLLNLLSTMLQGTSISELIDGRVNRLELDSAPGSNLRLSDLLRLPTLKSDTLVYKQAGVAFQVIADKSKLTVKHLENCLNLPVFLNGSLDYLLSGNVVQVGQIPGLLSGEGKVELARNLIRAGLLSIAKP